MTKSNLFQKIPPTVASEGVSRAKPLVCRRSYGQARHGREERFEQPACVWVNKERCVFALLLSVGALIDLDAAKASALKGCCVHLCGFLWCFEHLRTDCLQIEQTGVWDLALFPGIRVNPEPLGYSLRAAFAQCCDL